MIRWPRGKYNGRRIDGFELQFSMHLLRFRWKPFIRWNFAQPVIIWLVFTIRAELEYTD